jgi:hypothetical protein
MTAKGGSALGRTPPSPSWNLTAARESKPAPFAETAKSAAPEKATAHLRRTRAGDVNWDSETFRAEWGLTSVKD